MIGSNDWIEWLDQMVGPNGWIKWLDPGRAPNFPVTVTGQAR